MFFRQYYLDCLSHASYLIGDTRTGRAVVVDPQRDVDEYLADAAEHGLTIVQVLETHFHADFLSGHLELAARTGATIGYGRAAAGRAEFPIVTFADGDRIRLGADEHGVTLEIRETPGHTPESISIVVHDGLGDPYGVLTGDTLFIGDVGRPDLLASVGVTADELARQLYHSLHNQLLTLPDSTKVFPAHGAGSACGKSLSTETVSTIGEQRRDELRARPDERGRVRRRRHPGPVGGTAVLRVRRQPQPPTARPARRGHHGADADASTRCSPASRPAPSCSTHATTMAFAAGHLRGSINVGLGGRFAEYAGEVMQARHPDRAGHPARPRGRSQGAPGPHRLRPRRRRARPAGRDASSPIPSTSIASRASPPTPSRNASAELPELVLIDVRNPGEVALGSIPGARHLPLPTLLTRLAELDRHAPTVVFCAGGYRSAIASSLLRAHGFTDVSDLLGGYTAWTSRAADRVAGHAGS